MNTQLKDLKALVALSDRLQGFLEDGYQIQLEYKSQDLYFYKLVHHNGNRITLKYNVITRTISQSTNGQQTYESKVCEP